VHCWGENEGGQLGKGDTVDSPDPVLIAPLSDVSGVAAGGAFTCAFLQNGELFCWGENGSGQLGGAGDGSGSKVPALVMAEVKRLAAGARHGCAVLMDDTLTCWGDNTRGQSAVALLVGEVKPTPVAGLSGVTSVAAGHDFTCALGATSLSCWGDNTDLELTEAVTDPYVTTPSALDVMDVLEVALGADGQIDSGDLAPIGGHACALLNTNKITCWGNDRSGQLGRGMASPDGEEGAPEEIAGLDGVIKIAAGTEVSCAILDSGGVRCWGRNDRGQLGIGTTISAQSSPVAVVWP
jgi:alpha-tubulin suppressor-like RCC1 family protein